ncbi:MAG: extensin family protein [Polyangiaceae bacterium]|nr:extensin family protein [Polyangiaceae bacterium]
MSFVAALSLSCSSEPLARGPRGAPQPAVASTRPAAEARAPEPTLASPASGAPRSDATPRAPPVASAGPAPPRPPVFANLDPDDDRVVAPPDEIPDCASGLLAAGVRAEPARLPVRAAGGGAQCGAPQVVSYVRGPGDLDYRPPRPLLTCGMALALARFEELAQAEAEARLGSRIRALRHLGTYSCRKMARFRLVSEHSYANALDVAGFTLADGRSVDVLRDFGAPAAAPADPRGEFLRGLARRAYDEGTFSVVVTRFFDELHRDHLHLDLARYRVDGTR